MSSLPIISLAAFEEANSAAQEAGKLRDACLEHGFFVSSQKIGAFSKPDRFWKPVGFFPELLSMYVFST